MRNDAEAVVEGLYAAWRLQDVEATLAYCADDFRYTVHQPEGITGLGGKMRGKDQVREYLHALCQRWQFEQLAPVALTVRGDVVRGLTRFRSVHRRTGLVYAGRKRHVWRVKAGRIVKIDEYQDAVELKAFLAMAEAHCS